uniref:Tumor necrosis factor receptor II homolog n=1 Tax=Cowpox virus TaxID=10243 RepID=O57095_COWPX|nr:tumor necrosis factor receptor II homolog [Cowpox virus]
MMKMTPSYILLVYMFVVVSETFLMNTLMGNVTVPTIIVIIYVVNNAILECI